MLSHPSLRRRSDTRLRPERDALRALLTLSGRALSPHVSVEVTILKSEAAAKPFPFPPHPPARAGPAGLLNSPAKLFFFVLFVVCIGGLAGLGPVAANVDCDRLQNDLLQPRPIPVFLRVPVMGAQPSAATLSVSDLCEFPLLT